MILLGELLKHVESRYRLTLAAAQRANEIITGSPVIVDCSSKKPAVAALQEISENKVRYESLAEKPKKS